jgi:hypothetical protein
MADPIVIHVNGEEHRLEIDLDRTLLALPLRLS